MSSFTIVGKFIGMRPEKVISDNLTVQDFAIETNQQFYATMVFQMKNERRDVLHSFKKDDEVAVSFNIKCIKSENGNWFTTLEAWKVVRHVPQTTDDFNAPQNSKLPPMVAPPPPPPPQKLETVGVDDTAMSAAPIVPVEPKDDLPFQLKTKNLAAKPRGSNDR